MHDDNPPAGSPVAMPLDGVVFQREAWPLLPSLLRVALLLTADPHRAEDLVQEAMMRAYRHIGSYRPGTNIKAWLMTILRRTHVDLYRRDRRSVAGVGFDPSELEGMLPAVESQAELRHGEAEPSAVDPDGLLDRFDDQTIEDALRRLPEAMRWVLLLLDVEQLGVAGTAAALELPEGTVKSRASRARARLREDLKSLACRRGWLPQDARG